MLKSVQNRMNKIEKKKNFKPYIQVKCWANMLRVKKIYFENQDQTWRQKD